MSRRRDMERAQDAWERVTSDPLGKTRNKAEEDKRKVLRGLYGRRAQDLPALIMTDGLGQALAYLRAKSKGKKDDAHWLLYTHISTWVLGHVAQLPNMDGKDLLGVLMRADVAYYRRAMVETLAYAAWLKKFVEAEFGEEIQQFGEVETNLAGEGAA